MKRLGLAHSQSGVWTLWISLGKFRLILKKNKVWALLELWVPTRSFTIETGFARFPGFRVRFWSPAS